MRTLVIRRDRWKRGEKNSSLLGRDGRMCCLGFDCLDCGIPQEWIFEVAAPISLGMPIKGFGLQPSPTVAAARPKIHHLFSEHYDDNSDFARKAMMLNDVIIGKPKATNFGIITVSSEEEREKMLTYLFAEVGIELKFVT